MDDNPILNNPYEEPKWHYATNLEGELDYSRPVKGRRVFTPELQTIPVRWEGKAAKVLDDLADEGRVLAWVKNSFLDFAIPYIDKAGQQRDYYPDFIVRARTSSGQTINLILEITGMARDKPEKAWTVKEQWIPAINRIREQRGWERWDFLEIAEDIRDARNDLLNKLA